MKKQKNSTANLQVKIIAGSLKGRNIRFLEKKDLRPTKNQIRETLFNWLQYDLDNSVCIDLFSGSGALGFEAASRGAKKVHMVDHDSDVVRCLKDNKDNLKVENVTLYNNNAEDFIKNFKDRVDLIFLDPPFSENIINVIIHYLSLSQIFNDKCKIYIEVQLQKNLEDTICKPKSWELLKSSKSGDVAYLLYQHNNSMI